MTKQTNEMLKILEQINKLINNLQEDLDKVEDAGLRQLLEERIAELRMAKSNVARAINLWGVK